MGGKSKSTKNIKQDTVSQTKSISSTPGTEFGKEIVSGLDTNLGQINGIQAYGQDRFAAPPARNEGNQTNYQPAIDAGLASANQDWVQPTVQNLGNYWKNVSSGYNVNPEMDSVINNFMRNSADYSKLMQNQRDLTAGAEGAFGGTYNQQGNLWAKDAEGRAVNDQISQLRMNDYYNWMKQLEAAPGQLQQISAAGQIPANVLADWGGKQNANAWEKATQDQAIQQTNLDNEYNKYIQMIQGIEMPIDLKRKLMGIAAGAPGSTTDETGQQQMTGTETTTTKQSADMSRILGSIAGAIMTLYTGGAAAPVAAGLAGAGARAGG